MVTQTLPIPTREIQPTEPFSAIPEDDIPWLWPGRIPLRQISLLISRPGIGKSLLTTDIAARTSTAAPWPDESSDDPRLRLAGDRACHEPSRVACHEQSRAGRHLSLSIPCSQSNDDSSPHTLPRTPASVILIPREDDPAQVIRPRLLSHNADLAKIHILNAVRDAAKSTAQPEMFFSLQQIRPLEKALKAIPDCKLVIFDPIAAFFHTADIRYEGHVRAALSVLQHLAQRHGPAILLVHHFRKHGTRIADDSVLGSSALVSVCRNVLHLLPDPKNDSRRLLLSGKTNFSRRPPGLAFTIENSPIENSTDNSPHIHWDPTPIDCNTDTTFSPPPRRPGPEPIERSAAQTWLKELLNNGPLEVAKIRQESTQAGVNWSTLQRAAAHLQIQRLRRDAESPWVWKLPPNDHQHHHP